MLIGVSLSFCSGAQGEAVALACWEVSQKGMLRQRDVRDVSTPMLL